MKEKITTSAVLGVAALVYFGWVNSTAHPTIVQTEQISVSPSPQIEASQLPQESVVAPSEIPVPAESPIPSSSPVKATPTPKPRVSPSPKASPTVKPSPSSKPSVAQSPKTQKISDSPSGGFTCNCAKTCEQISSCAEAQYQLNSCGCSVRDRDKDGIACDSAPLNCQH